MDSTLISDMLKVKTWAVVGATHKSEKFGFKIFKFLRDAEYTVYAVNKGVKEVMGERCYESLHDLPVKPEAVNMVVPPKVGEQIVKECAELGILNVWFQPGAASEDLVNLAKSLGLQVIYDSCIMVEARKENHVK